MGRYRQAPTDLIRSQIDITDRLSTLESSPRAPTTAVDSGTWKFIASDGNEVIKFGDEGGGNGVGWVFRRGGNGSLAFYLGGNPSGNQFWSLNDNIGNTIMADDAATGQGISRPYVPYMAVKYSEYVSVIGAQTTSATFVPAYIIAGIKQHPIIETQYEISTPAGVSAQVQLVDTTSSDPASAIVIAGPDTYPGNTFTIINVTGSLDGLHMQHFKLDLQYRVSAGAGTIGITHVYSYGRQT